MEETTTAPDEALQPAQPQRVRLLDRFWVGSLQSRLLMSTVQENNHGGYRHLVQDVKHGFSSTKLFGEILSAAYVIEGVGQMTLTALLQG